MCLGHYKRGALIRLFLDLGWGVCLLQEIQYFTLIFFDFDLVMLKSFLELNIKWRYIYAWVTPTPTTIVSQICLNFLPCVNTPTMNLDLDHGIIGGIGIFTQV